MVDIPLPLSTFPGESPQESAGRIINGYAEPLGDGARKDRSYKRVPGMTLFGTTTQTGFRGAIEVAGSIRAVFNNRAVSINSAGVVSTIGNYGGTDRVVMARNNNASPQCIAVGADGVYLVNSGSVVSYPDADVGAPIDGCFLDGYFFFCYGDGRIRNSGLNATSINPNDFTTAESNPDGLLRVIPFNGQLLAFGQDSCEFYSGNPPNETGFPLNRVTSTPYGLLGKYAIAGHESGAGKTLLWVSKDHGVYMLAGGYQPVKVSPADLDRIIEDTDSSLLEASIYSVAGRTVWALSGPEWTYEFNLNSQKWNERASHQIERWRATQSFFAFNKWMAGDTQSANIYQIDPDNRREGINPLRFRLESGPVANFPNRTRIARIDVDVTTGVGIANGTANQSDPKIELSVARDCENFDDPRVVPLGRQARNDQRVFATRFGLSGPQGFRLRIDISDDVYASVQGASASAELRVK